MKSYANKLKTQLFWWLSKNGRPFIINDEYSIELLFIDKEALTAKILVTNLKTDVTEEQDMVCSFED